MPVASPAHDYVEETFDLQKVMTHPAATFPFRANGSIPEARIYHDDILLVDRSLWPSLGDVVVVTLDGKLLLKQWRWRMDHPNTAKLVATRAAPTWQADGGQRDDPPHMVFWGVVSVVIYETSSQRRGSRPGRCDMGQCPRATAHPQLSYT